MFKNTLNKVVTRILKKIVKNPMTKEGDKIK